LEAFAPLALDVSNHHLIRRHDAKSGPVTIFQKTPLTHSWGGISVPSTFDPARRPIYVHAVAEMTRKNEDYARPLIASAIEKVVLRHPSDKILVHTVSYALNRYVEDHLRQSDGLFRLVTYNAATEKQRAIDRYLSTEGSVFLAPSLDRGIDLPGDDCRVIVVCKVPFPSLGDKQISARMHSKGGQQWYAVKTIRSLVQMTGRGMRSADDYCESYILDKMFISQIWRRNRNLLPKWWSDALVWSRGVL
jgi:ATP-dependent DNA helicase DinG